MIKEINEGIYHLSKPYENEHFRTNTYLLVDGEVGILIEPGNLLDFDVIYEDIQSVIDPQNINYIILTHPDLDLSSSLPRFEEVIDEFEIVTEWRTMEVLRFFDLDNDYYLINEHHLTLDLSENRTLYFIKTPFAHYSGGFITYDSSSKLLFSGDLFGSMAKKWSLYADQTYYEGMALYHENYMPSSDFIKPIMKQLRKLDISMILPQHGSIIPSKMVKQSIHKLHDMTFFNSYNTVADKRKKNLKYDYPTILSQMITRLLALYDKEEIHNVFEGSAITITFNPITVDSLLVDYALWNRFFEIIYNKKGDEWLNQLESIVNRITRQYNIHKPIIYQSRLRQLKAEKTLFEEQTQTLEKNIETIRKEERKCQITGLFYDDILIRMLKDNIPKEGGLLFVELDQMNQIKKQYNQKTFRSTLRTMRYIITNTFTNASVYRGEAGTFIIYFNSGNRQQLKDNAVVLRNKLSESDQFITDVTAGIGLVHFDNDTYEDIYEFMHQGNIRRQLAHQSGYNMIIDAKATRQELYDFNVLLVDEDEIDINMITKYMDDENINVITATDPIDAMNIIQQQRIHLVISEINLSKLDGFSLKEQLNNTENYNKVPFIMISHAKSNAILNRINDLKVDFYLRKPFYPIELVGLVKRMMTK